MPFQNGIGPATTLRENGSGIGFEFLDGPPLRGVRTQEDSVIGIQPEVRIEIGFRRLDVDLVQGMLDGVHVRLGPRGLDDEGKQERDEEMLHGVIRW